MTWIIVAVCLFYGAGFIGISAAADDISRRRTWPILLDCVMWPLTMVAGCIYALAIVVQVASDKADAIKVRRP